jgi:DNA-binding transcriptional ArsR family regulator
MQVNDASTGSAAAQEGASTAGSTSHSPGTCCSGLAGLLSPKLFKALADPTRLSLLVRLAEEGGPFTVSQMAEGSHVDLSVISRHLATLREAGLITCAKSGKEVLCTVQTTAVAALLRDIADALEACCPGGARRTGAASEAAPDAAPASASPRAARSPLSS